MKNILTWVTMDDGVPVTYFHGGLSSVLGLTIVRRHEHACRIVGIAFLSALRLQFPTGLYSLEGSWVRYLGPVANLAVCVRP